MQVQLSGNERIKATEETKKWRLLSVVVWHDPGYGLPPVSAGQRVGSSLVEDPEPVDGRAMDRHRPSIRSQATFLRLTVVGLPIRKDYREGRKPCLPLYVFSVPLIAGCPGLVPGWRAFLAINCVPLPTPPPILSRPSRVPARARKDRWRGARWRLL